MYDRLLPLIKKYLPEDKIAQATPESRLIADLGMDSIGMLMLSMALEEEFGVSSLFSNRHYGSIGVCPSCGSSDWDEILRPEPDIILLDTKLAKVHYKGRVARRNVRRIERRESTWRRSSVSSSNRKESLAR